MTKYFAALLMFFIAWPSFAADPNGYTAQYECRAGGPHCNVDIAKLTEASCATTITTADSLATIESKLSSGASPICITNGDYMDKGTIWAQGSGSAGNYRVLRYTRSGDNNDEPWNQGANQVKIKRLVIKGSYWIVHRLTFGPVPSGLDKKVLLEVEGTISNVIFNRVLIEGSGAPSGYIYYGYSQNCNTGSYTDITFQNGVIRGQYGDGTSADSIGFNTQCATNSRIVNSELYDWAAALIQAGGPGGGSRAGTVFENNDMYYSPTAHTQGGTKMKGEGQISFKQSGTQASPALIIHNRIWGTRRTDLNFCCNGSSGSAVGLGSGGAVNAHWILFKNNIVFDSQQGIEWTMWNTDTGTAERNSIVGNLFYNIKQFDPGTSSAALWAGSYGVYTSEAYLNTIIDSVTLAAGPFKTNNDFRCNVGISGGANTSTAGSGTQWDYNTYYATANKSEANRIDKSLTTHANSKTYALNQIIRTGPASHCMKGTESACFLYRVTTAGTTSGSPAYCATLGCTQTDGTAVLQAIRGPYIFKRKLRTVLGGESYAIPYARAHISANELTCPTSLGSRSNIGINDLLLF